MTWENLLAYCLAKPGAWQDEHACKKSEPDGQIDNSHLLFIMEGVSGRPGQIPRPFGAMVRIVRPGEIS